MRYQVRLVNGREFEFTATGFHPNGGNSVVFYELRRRARIDGQNDQWGQPHPAPQRQESVAMFNDVESIVEVPEPEVGFPATTARLGGVGGLRGTGTARLGDADGIPLQPEPWATAPGNPE